MNKQLFHLTPSDIVFPPAQLALHDPDGLLAIGGCLSTERLKLAYSQGIFPWFNEQEPIMWWSPSERGIIELEEFKVNKTLKKAFKKTKIKVSVNLAFDEVIKHCRDQRIDKEGTWINSAMLPAYINAHRAGFAHSVEVWDEEGNLIGGLYGIMQSGVFCGESMFFKKPNASKFAMWALVNWMKHHNAHFIDCQLENPYLTSLGAKVIPRAAFLTRLKEAEAFTTLDSMWFPQWLDNIYD